MGAKEQKIKISAKTAYEVTVFSAESVRAYHSLILDVYIYIYMCVYVI